MRNGVLTSLHLLIVFVHVIWSDASQEPYIIVTMIFRHFFLSSFVGPLRQKTNEMKTSKNSSKGLHKFPFSCIIRNLESDCGPFLFDEASWDDLGRSSNCQYLLLKIGIMNFSPVQ